MSGFNKVIIVGNLTRDPELRFTTNGSPVAGFGVAVNEKWKDKSTGELKEDVAFVDITVWGSLAENCAQYLKKGSPALVEGKLKLEKWEKDGQNHQKLAVTANNVQFLSSPQQA